MLKRLFSGISGASAAVFAVASRSATTSPAARADSRANGGGASSTTSDVLVIGGGIVGASVALSVASLQSERKGAEGASVRILEKGFIGSGASGLSAGTIWCGGSSIQGLKNMTVLLCHHTMSLLRRVQEASDQAPRDDPDQIPYDCELRQCGSLSVATTRAQELYLRAKYAVQKRMGLDVEWLGSEELASVEPRLVDVRAAVHTPQSAHCNPMKTSIALAELAQAYGAETVEQVKVTALYSRANGGDKSSGPRFRVCTASGADFFANHVVVATGCGKAFLDPSVSPSSRAEAPWKRVGLHIPVYPVRGQIWTTGPLPEGFLSKVIFTNESHLRWTTWSSRDEDAPLVIPENCTHDKQGRRIVRHAYGRQCADGRVIFGGDRVRCKEGEFLTDGESTAANREMVGEFLPSVLGASVEGEWTGLMPFSLDGKPIIGELSGIGLPGLWLVTGFGPHGIMEGPGAGALVARAIVSGDGTSLPTALVGADPLRAGNGGVRQIVDAAS